MFSINKKYLKSNLKDSRLIVLLLLLITFFLYKFLIILPSNTILGDAQRYNGYQSYIIKHSLTEYHQLGLWDQLLSSGMSWISHPGGTQFFPTAWVVTTLFDNIMFGSRIFFLIHAATAALSMYFLLRIIGLSKFVSFFGAVANIANQYIILFTANGWFEEFFGFTLLPLSVGLLWKAVQDKNYIYAVLGGISMSMHFFGNTYYVVHYNLIVLLWVSIILLIYNRKNLSSFTFISCAFWASFLGISAIKLVPLLEFRMISSRNILPLSKIETSSEVMTLNFIIERLHSFFVPASHATQFAKWGNNIAILLLFIAVVTFLKKRYITHMIFLGMLLIGIWGYLANRLPIDFYKLMYYFLPGFNSNQFPYRFFIIIHFAFMTSISLGLNSLISQKRKYIKLVGYIFGSVILISTFQYTNKTFNSLNLPQAYNIKRYIDKPATFKINSKLVNFEEAPILQGEISNRLLITLAQIMQFYRPEGRVYSTFNSSKDALTNTSVFLTKIPSVHHSYNPIVPTYQYGMIKQGTSQDSLELTKKRYKTFSVLNARFHLQQKEYLEYAGCKKLDQFGFVNQNPIESVCDFLEERLTPLVLKENGGIYYDREVLPKITLIPYAILIINDNRFNDYSSFIAKQIMFHPDFDLHKLSVLSGGSSYVDDYAIDTLTQFKTVLLVDAKKRDDNSAEKLLSEYKQSGGRVLTLSSNYTLYDSLHDRSSSIYTDRPAWDYSQQDQLNLANIFQSFTTSDNLGIVDIVQYTPEESTYTVSTSKDNTVLQFSDSFYPGWKAKIDGKKVPLYMADGLVKGIIIREKGIHAVKFYYRPDSLIKGALITLITAVSLFFLFIFSLYKRIKR